MKKEVRKRTRSKWFLGVGIGLACVALASTGFAVWIVSASVTSVDTDQTTVGVDTAQNESVALTAVLVDEDAENEGNTGALRITENYSSTEHTDAYVTNDSTDADFSVNLSTLTITAGAQYLENYTINGVDIAIKSWVLGESTDVYKVSNNDSDLIGARDDLESEAYWTYVDLSTTSIAISNFTLAENQDGTSTYSINEGSTEIAFAWGTFFNSSSPCTYYNGLFEAETISPNTETLAAVTNELNAMYSAMEGSTVTLEISLNVTAK